MILRKVLPILIAFFLFGGQAQGQKEYKVERLNGGINTSGYDEISPVVSLDGKTLYFTRIAYPDFDKTLVEDGENLYETLSTSEYESYIRNIYSQISGRSEYDITKSRFNQDVWIAESTDGKFDKVVHPGYPLNNALPNSISALTPSENELITINQFVKEGGMKKGFSIVRKTSDGSWTFPEGMQINNYHNSGPDVSITMSADGEVLIISLEREDSRGKSDLYVSFRQGEQWTTPKNLGSKINSSYRETTPFLSEDKSLLFFSSDRHGTIGGNDLFMVERLDDSWTNWSQTRRFVEPINSKGHETQPFFNSATGYMYFTSNRNGTNDIYRAKLAGANPRWVTIRGRILNSKTGEQVSAEVLSGAKLSSNKNIYVSDDGTYEMKLAKGIQYEFLPKKAGFTGRTEIVSFKKRYAYFKTYNIDLFLDPLEEGAVLALDPIYFEQSKAFVLKSSHSVLDELATFLNENLNIYVEVSGHTDNQGSEKSLIKLSQDRANAIKNYLVKKRSVNPLRISAVGYGASQPIADNKKENLRSKNRRVEVKITSVEDTNITAGLKSKGKKKE